MHVFLLFLGDDNKDLILESVEEFHNKTCLQFRERKNETSYIMLVPGSGYVIKPYLYRNKKSMFLNNIFEW